MKFDFSQGFVGPVSAGMTRMSVRHVLQGEYKEFRKSEFATNTTDAYRGLGIFVYYSAENVVKGTELFPPQASLNYRGKDLLLSNYLDICAFLKTEGVRYSEDQSQVELLDERIRLYMPDKIEDKNAKVESAYVVLAGASQ
jgi:hypothetical protein